MKKLLLACAVLFIGAWCGVKIAADPGYVLVSYKHWSAEMPLWFLVLAWFAGYVVLALVRALWNGSFALSVSAKHFFSKRSDERSRNLTNKGFMAYAEGHWDSAEKLLLKGAKESKQPLINYLAAAMAAQKTEDYEKRDKFLQSAHRVMPEAQVAILLTQAQLQFDAHQLEQALATLRHIEEIAPSHPYVLRLLKDVYEQVGDYDSLLDLLPRLLSQKVVAKADKNDQELKIHQARLQSAITQELGSKVHLCWQDVPRSLRKHEILVSLYASFLARKGDTEQACELIASALKSSWSPKLIKLYGSIHCGEVAKQRKVAESFLKLHGGEVDLVLCLTRLCMREKLWGQAKDYCLQAIEQGEVCEALYLYGELLEQAGEPSEALRYYKMASGGQIEN